MSEPHRHHIVGRFYLKHFTTTRMKDGPFHVIDVRNQIIRPSTPIREPVIKDFNRDEGLTDPMSVEKYFADIEGMIAPALDETVERGKLPESLESRAWLVTFAALTIARLPAFRLQAQGFRPKMGGRAELLPRDLPPAIEKLVTLLHKRWWRVHKFPVSAGTLVASDCPAILTARSTLLPFTPDNFVAKTGIIVFPLSSDCFMLSGVPDASSSKNVPLDTLAVAMANGWQIQSAFSRAEARGFPPRLFSPSPDFPITDRCNNLTTFRKLYPEFHEKISPPNISANSA